MIPSVEASCNSPITHPPIIRRVEDLGIPPLPIKPQQEQLTTEFEQQLRKYQMTYGENLTPDTPEPIRILGVSELPPHLGSSIIVPIQFFIPGTTQKQIDQFTAQNEERESQSDNPQDILSRTIYFKVTDGANSRKWDAVYEISPRDMTHLEQITTSPDGITYVARSRAIGPGVTKTVTIDIISPDKSVESIKTDFAPHSTATTISPDGGLFIVGNHFVNDEEVDDWKLSHISPHGTTKEVKRIEQTGLPANVFVYDPERLIITSDDTITITSFKGDGATTSGFFSRAENSIYISQHKHMVRMESGGDGMNIDVTEIDLNATARFVYAMSVPLPPHDNLLPNASVDARKGNFAFDGNTLSVTAVFKDRSIPGFPSFQPQTRHLAIMFATDGSFEVVDTSLQPDWTSFGMNIRGSYITDGVDLRQFDLTEILPTSTSTPTTRPTPTRTLVPSPTPTPHKERDLIFLPVAHNGDRQISQSSISRRHLMRFNSHHQ